MRKFKLKKQNKGLTLIETLVAISVLLIGVVFPMSIYSQSITNTRYAGDQITAYYLAQEGLEFIKYRVNTNLNDGSNPDWLNGLTQCIQGGGCRVDSKSNDICWNNGPNCNSNIKLDNNGLYNYSTGNPTIFRRDVNIIDSGTEATIIVTVSWTRVGISKTLNVKENIYDWR